MEFNYISQLLVEEDAQRCSQPVRQIVVEMGVRDTTVVFPRSCGKLVAELGTRLGIAVLLYHALIKSHVLLGETPVKL